jgi:hypothetical protein
MYLIGELEVVMREYASLVQPYVIVGELKNGQQAGNLTVYQSDTGEKSCKILLCSLLSCGLSLDF